MTLPVARLARTYGPRFAPRFEAFLARPWVRALAFVGVLLWCWLFVFAGTAWS